MFSSSASLVTLWSVLICRFVVVCPRSYLPSSLHLTFALAIVLISQICLLYQREGPGLSSFLSHKRPFCFPPLGFLLCLPTHSSTPLWYIPPSSMHSSLTSAGWGVPLSVSSVRVGLSLHSSVEAAVKFRLSKSAERAFKSEPSYLYCCCNTGCCKCGPIARWSHLQYYNIILNYHMPNMSKWKLNYMQVCLL